MPTFRNITFTRVCNDPRLRWDVTACLCDCHYGWRDCGDHDAAARSVSRVRITRRARKVEA